MSEESPIVIIKSDFDSVKKYWSLFLWPERRSSIEEKSWIDINGEINLDLKLGSPSFFAAIDDKSEVVAVVSGHSTSEDQYRLRGIWVKENFRKRAIGSMLVAQIQDQAFAEKRKLLWTMPRMNSKEFYFKLGFKEQKFLYSYEFGPHIIATKLLRR